MQCFTRSIIPLVLIAGLCMPQALANEGGGEGGRDPTVTEKGAKSKRSGCEELARLARDLANAKQKAADLRAKLARARDTLADAKESPESGRFQRVRSAKTAVADATDAYEDALAKRNELQRRYDKLRRLCS